MTTAEKLNAYRLELLKGGIAEYVVDDLIKDAADVLVRGEGLTTRTAQPSHASTAATGASNADWSAGYAQGYAAGMARQ